MKIDTNIEKNIQFCRMKQQRKAYTYALQPEGNSSLKSLSLQHGIKEYRFSSFWLQGELC
jgi:hypothetical protein